MPTLSQDSDELYPADGNTYRLKIQQHFCEWQRTPVSIGQSFGDGGRCSLMRIFETFTLQYM